MHNKTGYTGDISGWDVSNVTDFTVAFSNSDFNGDISGWDTRSAVNFGEMFAGNTAFNQDLSLSAVSNVTNFSLHAATVAY